MNPFYLLAGLIAKQVRNQLSSRKREAELWLFINLKFAQLAVNSRQSARLFPAAANLFAHD
jgi:hypothetical protein